ncbi:hypothetical protein CBA19CS22_06145 [Caballeronia novacaledonica]|uniref:Uncharacterized protein n=1 Tax=Caballeronia novacaledonica TaxID=1544861 RepID=A0ACB5QMC7_9BURK|nr:hypothetical protein CBA19CS22_06145 [Caballeronia novacaledonica]
MIDLSAVATVFSVYAVGVVIPGPNFVAVVHRAVSGGRSDTLALVAGIVTINLFWATCAILGIGMVFAVFPWLAVGVRLAGAGLSRLVWATAYYKGASERHSNSAASEDSAVSCRFSSGRCDKYCEPEVHRFLCSGVFVSGIRPRFI